MFVALFKWLLIMVQKKLMGGSTVPLLRGKLSKTPRELLDLRPGELVPSRRRRRLRRRWTAETATVASLLTPRCCVTAEVSTRVLRRVSRMINEGTGELFELPGECIVLDTVTCTAEYHRLCRRSHFPYWREIWLTRVTQPVEIISSAQQRAR